MRNVSVAIVSIACVLSSIARAQAPTGTQAKVLHLTAPHIVIDQPGMYVLDRNWVVPGTGRIIEITADDVVLDLRGFSIELRIEPAEGAAGVYIAGDNVTLRNGKIVTTGAGNLLWTDGASTVIDTIQMQTPSALVLNGPDATVTNSSLKAPQGLRTHTQGDRYFIEGNRIDCVSRCLSVSSVDGGLVRNNELYRSDDTGVDEAMVFVGGTGTTFENNYLENVEVFQTAIKLSGDQNVVTDNTMILTRGLFSGFAILVDEGGSSENVINGNIASASTPNRRWEIGIGFMPGSGNNFFGDNRMEAFVPVLLQNTTQVDWGGNVGY